MALEKPEIDFPEGNPPKDLEIVDLVEGDGPEAKHGQNVRVHYVGVAFSTGEEFDASWNRGDAFEFPLGLGEPHFDDDAFDAKLEIVCRQRPPIVSFTFGCPAPEQVKRM